MSSNVLFTLFRSETSVGSPSYKTYMKLTIFHISEMDYGTYKCIAKNPRGETDGTIRVYGESKISHFKSSKHIRSH